MKKYAPLALLAGLTTVLVGLHVSWLWGLTTLLGFLWFSVLGNLTFNRKPASPLDHDLIPGDPANLDKLYQRAIQYCDEVINYYEGARYTTRRYFIVFQLATAGLTGLTPILVLMTRAQDLTQNLPQNLQTALNWATIIVPGIAAILATTSTLFNFQEEWIQAKKTAESLEALREEFMIGVSPHYQISALDPLEKQQQRKRALENFIVKVNELHLQQVDRWASLQRLDQQHGGIFPQSVPVTALENGSLTGPPGLTTGDRLGLPDRHSPTLSQRERESRSGLTFRDRDEDSLPLTPPSFSAAPQSPHLSPEELSPPPDPPPGEEEPPAWGEEDTIM
ncbi:DUF4231 domain-containing protein [Lyngbya confervoides]|uniref:DUF4231 domain-containing protein n=1 Tax=Lyngbya confervoides BDU141951 TaxID=1574623 RepID=A0ABD4SZB5_9CYAN|nr:DUF4231 domain-containing protein [Lyngbya confervoides]MCM1981652.1 DUF4231 domain-containing protein [Lyngbya confervoides BDU141951]